MNASRKQPHEIVFFKVEDDAKTGDVVAAADNEDFGFFGDFRGVSFAEPLDIQRTEEIEEGEETVVVGRADLSDEGRYAYICFVPDEKTGSRTTSSAWSASSTSNEPRAPGRSRRAQGG